MEGDDFVFDRLQQAAYFNPLPPHGGRRNAAVRQIGSLLFQSTPSAWRETARFSHQFFRHIISIHSLRMEGDFC